MSGDPASRYRPPRAQVRGATVAAAALAGLSAFVLFAAPAPNPAAPQSAALKTFDVLPAEKPAPLPAPQPESVPTKPTRPVRLRESTASLPRRTEAPSVPLTAPHPPLPDAAPPLDIRLPAAPLPPPPPPPPREQADKSARDAYARSLWQRIAARRPSGVHIPGTAELTFSLSASGALERVSVTGASGNAALDRLALRTVRRAAPFPAPPAALGREPTFTIAFRFD
ncbi:energy transducer TonB family protein [Stakelama marina]|uniref:TonB family protein n=1 Tax=Stakelama marina TaxID=2826939 RepID=A0A8T4IAC9_9SPHN|nr:TonB family protein [Stakelama marina]MBR0551092.1 TonB family protein [Stakelama marina]